MEHLRNHTKSSAEGTLRPSGGGLRCRVPLSLMAAGFVLAVAVHVLIPADDLAAADEGQLPFRGRVSLDLPAFNGPSNITAPQTTSPSQLPSYRGPNTSTNNAAQQSKRIPRVSGIQIIPAKPRGTTRVATNQSLNGTIPGAVPTEPPPFSPAAPTRRREAKSLGRVNMPQGDHAAVRQSEMAGEPALKLPPLNRFPVASGLQIPDSTVPRIGHGSPSIMPNTAIRFAQNSDAEIPLPRWKPVPDPDAFDLSRGRDSAAADPATGERTNSPSASLETGPAANSFAPNSPTSPGAEPSNVNPEMNFFEANGGSDNSSVGGTKSQLDAIDDLLFPNKPNTGSQAPSPADRSFDNFDGPSSGALELPMESAPMPSAGITNEATNPAANDSIFQSMPPAQDVQVPAGEFETFPLNDNSAAEEQTAGANEGLRRPAAPTQNSTADQKGGRPIYILPGDSSTPAPEFRTDSGQESRTPGVDSPLNGNVSPSIELPSSGFTTPLHGEPVYQPPIAPIQPPVYHGHSLGGPTGGSSMIAPSGPSHGDSWSGHSVGGPYPGTSGYRATMECDAPIWLSPYRQRVSAADSGSIISAVRNLPTLPPGYSPWWDNTVRQSSGPGGTSIPVDVGTLLQDAMLHSPQVIAIQAEPEVQYRVVTQEAAKFDWTAFLETTYDDLNDPVGNTLTTADGKDRLLTRKFRGSGGLRRKNLHGGEFRIAQDIGHENQSSTFFVPNNQGTARLELSYRQPLLDGAGQTYNRSEIVLANIAANSSEDEVTTALQDHLIEVTEAYWALYRSRAEFFQRQKLLASAGNVLVRLEGRSQVDTIPRQVLRARAAVARAQTRIQRTLARVEDAESQLRLLVNSPDMLTGGPVEVIPLEAPNMVTENADLQSVLQTALSNRPDISEAIRKMRASSVRLGVSRKELLPRLDLLVETYVSDLSGNSDVASALRGTLRDNRPGYTVGLELEIPLENRAAVAKLEQRQWELKRSINVFRATVEKSLTDAEIARREVATAYSEIVSRYHSMMAAEQESRYLADRFTVLPAAEDSATLLLEDLLDSFERLADEESSFVQAQVDHAIALVQLKREMGILLRSRNARPEIGTTEREFMNTRLHASASRKPGGRDSQGSPADPNVRVVGHQLGGPPVAAFTTTWSRPVEDEEKETKTPVAEPATSGGYSDFR